MKRRLSFSVFICLLYTLVVSCEESKPVKLETTLYLNSMNIAGYDGRVNGSFIDFDIPKGIDITKVAPKVDMPEGVTISPAANEEQNFKEFVQYTFSSSKHSYAKQYVIRVNQPKFNETKILSFALGNLDARRQGNTIYFVMKFKANLTAVKPKIKLSYGATSVPAVDETVDLSKPVIYKVTSEDKKNVQEYRVVVTERLLELAPNNKTIRIREGLHILPEDGYVEKFRDKVYRVVSDTSMRRLIKENIDTVSSLVTTYVTDMSELFINKKGFNSDVSHWDVSSVTDMSGMFKGARAFDQDLNEWDVSKVKSMKQMFMHANSFKGLIHKWDVSSVQSMVETFRNAVSFNDNLSRWDVRNVTDMHGMFRNAQSFNQDISPWQVNKVINMALMFSEAREFNQHLDTWNVSQVEDMEGMFFEAILFNGKIGKWNTSKVTDMYGMFKHAFSFNQNVGQWDVSSVQNMDYMFSKAYRFSKSLKSWCVRYIHTLPNEFGFNKKDAILPIWGTCPVR